jgi:pyruvate/2-oxoglutarate dehydrogenase complex dihydrolipoamide dehydrogenase (E3) component
VGAGTAARLLGAGLTVALVEFHLVGGECGNYACIPSKALLRPGHATKAARRVAGASAAVTGEVSATDTFAFRDLMISNLDDTEKVTGMRSAGIDFIRGRGRLDGPRRVRVETSDGGEVVLEARLAVILATGSTAYVPDIPGLAQAEPWTNRGATTASHTPRRLIVLGSGPVGLEMAQAWKNLGSETVTVVARERMLLPALEPFAGEQVMAGLRSDGIDLRLGVVVDRVNRPQAGGEVVVDLQDGSSITADELLVATGRQPGTHNLGLDTLGLQPGAYLSTDDTMVVRDHNWLYAIGDVNGHALLTHQGKYQGRVAADAIIARAAGEEPHFAAEADHAMVPQVIFTDPEVASVGLTQARALEQGLSARRVETDLGQVPGALLYAGGYTGRASLVVDDDSNTILGATFVGQDVAEMVHAATVAIVGAVTLDRLRHAVPSFPTINEAWLDLIELGRQRPASPPNLEGASDGQPQAESRTAAALEPAG